MKRRREGIPGMGDGFGQRYGGRRAKLKFQLLHILLVVNFVPPPPNKQTKNLLWTDSVLYINNYVQVFPPIEL